MIKPSAKDLILCGTALLLTGIFCVFIYCLPLLKEGTLLYIYQNGVLTETCSLKDDQTLHLTNDGIDLTLEIKNGLATVIASKCPSQDCVHSSPISKDGQSILCAPQKVLLVVSGAKNEYDAVVQ